MRLRFYLDNRDGFYKCPFSSVSVVKSVHNYSLIKPESGRSEKLKMFTNEQIERAERAISTGSLEARGCGGLWYPPPSFEIALLGRTRVSDDPGLWLEPFSGLLSRVILLGAK